ncbi:MAG TPA: GNAT family N-acetyltransferase [Candidatus Paceibacterota bacterium]|nr:GNAT family N-acetyltransferase [Candidatus Paceibacterota bacterium]
MNSDGTPSVTITPHGAELYTLTIEDDGSIVGHLRLYIMDIWWNGGPTGDRKANIQDVWVHPDHRGRGYGKFLMDVAEEKARALDCKLVELTSDPNNPERRTARAMYLRRGYAVTTEGFRLRLDR